METNLRRIIKMVLKEEFNPKIYLLRRMSGEEISLNFNHAIEYLSKSFRKVGNMRRRMSYQTYKIIILDMMTLELEHELYKNDDFGKIKEIKDFLYSEYRDRIISSYEELTGTKFKE